MLLLAAGHIQFTCNLLLQFYNSSFRRVKIIQNPVDTYYSNIFKCKLFIPNIH